MWITLSPAIIGFAGVLVGAIITTGATYLLAVRKEAVEATKDRLSRAIELKTAARLIAQEFLVAQTAVRILVEKKFWVPEEIKFPLDAWQRYKATIALELPLKDWNAVTLAAMAVEHFRIIHAMPSSSDNAIDPIVELAKSVLREISAGIEALRPYMLDAVASSP